MGPNMQKLPKIPKIKSPNGTVVKKEPTSPLKSPKKEPQVTLPWQLPFTAGFISDHNI